MIELNKPSDYSPAEIRSMPRPEYEEHKAEVLAHAAAEARNKLTTPPPTKGK